jgi:TonB family protein
MRDESPPYAMLAAVLVASAGMHLLLWPLGDEVLGWAWESGPLPAAEGIMEVSLLEAPEEPDPEEPDPEEPIDPEQEQPGKLVQLDRVTDERAPESDTPYISEFDNRTSKPTRAPNVHPQPGAAPVPAGDDGRNGKEPETPTDVEPKPLSLLPGTSETTKDDPIDPDEKGELGTGGKGVPSPAGSPGSRKAIRDALGSPGSFDDIDDGAEEDDETSVDSKRWKFASFFNRVRNGIAQHWHPEVVHAANDPDGRRYGTKTRRTKLIISLNKDGSLSRVRLESSSDVDYLDEEAIHAVRTAAPFANPPPGLVDPTTGLIEFSFGFIFEFGGTNRIFRYQR